MMVKCFELFYTVNASCQTESINQRKTVEGIIISAAIELKCDADH